VARWSANGELGGLVSTLPRKWLSCSVIKEFIAIALLAVNGCSHSGPRSDAPLLEFVPQEIFATEQSAPGGVVEVTLANRSRRPVTVDRLASTCGCTAAELAVANPIPPGGAAKVRLKLSIPSVGDQQSTVNAFVTGSAAPAAALRLILHGKDIEPPTVWAAPPRVMLTGDEPGGIAVREITITTLEAAGEPQWLVGMTVPKHVDWLTAEVRGSPIEQPIGTMSVLRTYQITLRGQLPASPNASAYADVSLDTLAGGTRPPPTIAVVSRAEPKLYFSPSELVIPIPDDDSPVSKRSAFHAPAELATGLRCDAQALPKWLSVMISDTSEPYSQDHVVVELKVDSGLWRSQAQRDSAQLLTFRSASGEPVSATLSVRCYALDGR